MDFIKAEIEDYISKRKFINLATSSKKGDPLSNPLAYVNIGNDVYFSTNKMTRKVKNILENPNVAYTIYDNTDHLDEIRLLQMEGKATIIKDKRKHQEIINMLKEKYPISKTIPLNSDTVVVKITPKSCYFFDYIKRFGQIEKIKF